MKQLHPKNAAFSLLELIAVVTIIGILATIIMPRISTSSLKAKQKTCSHNRAHINNAAEIYYMKNNAFPTALADINTPDTFPEGIPTCPVSGAAYTLNASTHRVQGHINSHP